MKLMTKEVEKKLPKLYSTEKTPAEDKTIVVKFFLTGSKWTWYAVEGEQNEDGDWLFFGLVDGHEMEWGYFSLSELQSLKNSFGLGVERDRYFGEQKVKDVTALKNRL